MFRIVCDPSSGSIKLYLTEIHSGNFSISGVCVRGVRYDGTFVPYTHTTGSKIMLPNTD